MINSTKKKNKHKKKRWKIYIEQQQQQEEIMPSKQTRAQNSTQTHRIHTKQEFENQ